MARLTRQWSLLTDKRARVEVMDS
ncbi:UNVERIFIED_CONTAM: hypothetical protein GTU68_043776 [Idotea baltica]|nr:hypothetical protein [Idotea baltica]